jgi:hypothetical protein
VIPVEVTQALWAFWDWLCHWKFWDWLDHWQTLVAGLIALFAAIITVWVTLRVERGKAEREVDALRKSLGVELRLQIAAALGVYDGLYGLGLMSNALISGPMVEDKSRMAAPIIYPANAGKIGLLGAEAMDVMIVYDLLETARNGAARLMVGAPNKISAPVVMKAADAFLATCIIARSLLPRLRTGVASHDTADEALIQKINDNLATQRAAHAARVA